MTTHDPTASTRSQQALKHAARAAQDYLGGLSDRSVAAPPAAQAALGSLDGPWPAQGTDVQAILNDLHQLGSPATTATAGGRFYGLVVGGTLPAALGARVLTSAWDQIVFSDAISPVGCALERVAARWVLAALHLPPEAHVSFVTGASMGNFTCLAAARHALLLRAGHDVNERGLWGAPPLRVVVSDEIHVTVLKALNLLGFGQANIQRVPTDEQGRLIPEQLPHLDDRTIVCVQAGNVNSGSFDPFDAVCDRAHAANAWVHVDGAFGLWAAASPARAHLTQGLHRADSWVTDGHKWLNTPYDCGMAITRHPDALHAAMATVAPYLASGQQVAPKDMGPEFSRSARGTEVWAALKSLGQAGLEALIERNCAQARQFAHGLEILGYRILNDVVLNQVVATLDDPHATTQVAAHVQASGECWFGTTTWRGRPALRLSCSNWSTTEDDVRRSLRAIEKATEAVRT